MANAEKVAAVAEIAEQFSKSTATVVTEYRDGGWTFEALREAFPAIIEGSLQPVGETLPPLPEELRPESTTQQS